MKVFGVLDVRISVPANHGQIAGKIFGSVGSLV